MVINDINGVNENTLKDMKRDFKGHKTTLQNT